jgi:proteasome lid subunit RPN8/RPN11
VISKKDDGRNMKIKEEVLIAIIAHAEKQKPIEACGYLAGTNGIISRHYELTNADNSPEHYSFVPEEQFDTVRKARKDGLTIAAVYHSHPASPARMSDEDIRLAYDPDIFYIIVSLHEGISVRCFKMNDKMPEEEILEVVK